MSSSFLPLLLPLPSRCLSHPPLKWDSRTAQRRRLRTTRGLPYSGTTTRTAHADRDLVEMYKCSVFDAVCTSLTRRRRRQQRVLRENMLQGRVSIKRCGVTFISSMHNLPFLLSTFPFSHHPRHPTPTQKMEKRTEAHVEEKLSRSLKRISRFGASVGARPLHDVVVPLLLCVRQSTSLPRTIVGVRPLQAL